MNIFHLIHEYWYYIPPVMIGWNILARIIYAVVVMVPTIIGITRSIYQLGYILTVGTYILVRKLYRKIP